MRASIEQISSAQNPKIRQLLSLQEKSRTRREKGLFVVEGLREVERCIAAGLEIDSLFICPDILPEIPPSSPLAAVEKSCKVFGLSREIYAKIAFREGTEGVVAEVKCVEHGLDALQLGDNPLVVVLEAVEKPGNLGAVLRSADAVGADAVIVCDPLTDLYNPNLIRSSTGAVFSQKIACCTSEDAIRFLRDRGIQILTAQLQDSVLYYDSDLTRPTAIVMGTEATGLTQIWRDAADAHIRIPMLGVADSLNVSVSAAVLLYEAVRQRRNM